MKKLVKMALFFSLSFAVLFLAAAGMRFLALRLEWVRILPQRPETPLASLINAAYWALSFTLYGSLLLSLSYAARERVFMPVTAACLMALSLGLGFGIFVALEQWENVPPAQFAGKTLGGPGLILSNTMNGNETAIVLLKGPVEAGGPRVAAIPGRVLFYQEEAPGGASLGLPPVPFRNETPWFLRSLAIDIRLSTEQMRQRYLGGLLPFVVYVGALIFFLSSLGFIFRVSAWPLANLFLGCLAFRGVLALETFFNSPDMQSVFESILRNRLPLSLAVPLIFCGFGLLVYIYSALVYLAKRRDSDED
jgi:hypothetical protein